MAETYENIRDNSEIVPREARVAWIEADQSERMLRYQYDRLTEDADLNDEAKARRAGEVYEQHRKGIERKKQAAKDSLIKASRSAVKSSIPTPSGEASSSTDPTKLLLDQNEANRIVRTVERRGDKGPFSQSSSEYLKQEYERGLEIGGVEGGAICQGALRAAQELGAGDEWLPRNDRQRELLDQARRLEHFSGFISTSAPKPPKSLGKASGKRFMQPAPVMSSGGPPLSAPDDSHGGASKQKRASRRSRKNFS